MLKRGLLIPVFIILAASVTAIPEWDNAKGPYGGDRKVIAIDPHNPNILFTDSADDSGVWISKTAAEPTGNPYNAAWQHTKLDRGYQKIRGITSDGTYNYLFSGTTGSAYDINRLKYPKDFQEGSGQDPQNKQWEKINIIPVANNELTNFFVDPYRPRVFKTYTDDIAKERKLFVNNDFAEPGTQWTEVRFDMSNFPVAYDKAVPPGPFSVKLDPDDSQKLYAVVVYQSGGILKNAIMSYHVQNGWQLISEEFSTDSVLINSYDFSTDRGKFYLTAERISKIGIGTLNSVSGQYSWEYRDIKSEAQTTIDGRPSGIKVSPHDNSVFFGIHSSDTIPDNQVRGIYKSENQGRTWRKAIPSDNENMAFLKNTFFFDSRNPNLVYAGLTEKSSVMKSVDKGNNWYITTEGLSGINIFGVAITADKIYGVSQSALAINEDGLKTNVWKPRQITDPNGAVIANLYGGVEVDPFDERIVLVGAGYWAPNMLSKNGGIFRNTNSGYSDCTTTAQCQNGWERVLRDSVPNDGRSNPQIMDILFSRTTAGLVFGAARRHGYDKGEWEIGLYVSKDHGKTWKWVYAESNMFYIAHDPYDSKTYYAVGHGKSQGGKVIKLVENPSFPNGVQVVESNDIPLSTDDFFFSIDIQQGLSADKAYAFLGTQRGKVYRIPLSDLSAFNFGKAELVGDLNGWDINAVIAIDPNRPAHIYVGGKDKGIFRSTDTGDTWQDYSQGLTSSARDIYEIKFSPSGNRLYAGTLGAIAIIDLQPEPPICGNGICEPGETPQNCPDDCNAPANPGDVNSDGRVDIFDLVIVAQNFGLNPCPGVCKDPRADVNSDGVVNIFDLVIVAQNFGG